MTEIGTDAFQGCTGLREITIPNSVTEISTGTFSGCTGLEKIVISGSVKEIKARAFVGCNSLKSLIMQGTAPAIEWYSQWDDSIFEGTHPELTIYIPEGSEQSYSGEGWDDMKLVVYKKPVIQDSEQREESHSHSYSENIRKQPTCTEAGLREYICDCGSSYSAVIPALGHEYSGNPVSVCIRCGESGTEPAVGLAGDDSLVYATAQSGNQGSRQSNYEKVGTETSGNGKTDSKINGNELDNENLSDNEKEINNSNPDADTIGQRAKDELLAKGAGTVTPADTEQIFLPKIVEGITETENRTVNYWWILLVAVAVAGGGIFAIMKKSKRE